MNNIKVLIVEDDPFIRLDMEMQLEDAHCEIIGSACNATGATTILDNSRPDFAVLDFNLGNHDSSPVAEKLQKMDVPFCYVTSYSAEQLAERDAPEAPVIDKPFTMNAIQQVFSALTSQHTAIA